MSAHALKSFSKLLCKKTFKNEYDLSEKKSEIYSRIAIGWNAAKFNNLFHVVLKFQLWKRLTLHKSQEFIW